MSAVTVIYNRDNKPVNHKIFRTIFSKLDYRGLDGRNIVHNGSVTIGHQHFWTTPEEVDEIQPLIDTENKITLAFDGRIDNRDELLELAGYKNKDSKISDARLLQDLYIKFRSNLFEKLIGPFLIIIHDQTRKELLLVRDPVGDRTIYYYYDEKVFIASSEEHSILEHPLVSRELNEKSIVNLLNSSLPDFDQTFFKSIKELPPAHIIKFKHNNLLISRYWNFTKSNDRKYSGSLDNLAEEYYSLLNDSVKSCLRSVYKPAVMMSGGIDSTTVAYFAVNNLNSNGFELPLTTISGVFNELSNCNESVFIDDLAGRLDINAVKIPCDDAYPLRDEKKFFRNPNTPFDDSFRILTERVYSAALDSENKVILTGHFADDLYFKGRYNYLLELLKHGKIQDFIINLIILYKKEGFKQFFKHPALRRLFGFYRAIFGNKPKIPKHIKFKDNALKIIYELFSDRKNDCSYINVTNGLPPYNSTSI